MALYALMIFFFAGAVTMLIIGKTSEFFFSEWPPRALAILSFAVSGQHLLDSGCGGSHKTRLHHAPRVLEGDDFTGLPSI